MLASPVFSCIDAVLGQHDQCSGALAKCGLFCERAKCSNILGINVCDDMRLEVDSGTTPIALE